MTDSSEAFRSLVKDERFEYIQTAIAQRLAEHPELLPDDSQVSQHDKDMVDVFGKLLVWVATNEEKAFTGDPIEPLPEHPVAILVLRRIGLLDEPIA